MCKCYIFYMICCCIWFDINIGNFCLEVIDMFCDFYMVGFCSCCRSYIVFCNIYLYINI